ncbi:hypothetical protein THYS13_13930 [Thermoanaerobacter sp. YS13]|uniref:hypothetical protein n=1 Tax=Thermoanaerobacter sp. YS13 TaxID=1511746 RepID=UPI0005730E1F|nr:hypothetical protein [Thermoanaerobacter sp. YS13]KHO63272.1 hypothetical protein THYS13_13930 [Thermoanaerobacter sp. YS13]
MPIGLRFCKISQNNLPKRLGEKFEIMQQITIWEEENNKTSSIEYIGKSEYGNYDKYKITYFVEQTINGYYKDIKIENILVKEERVFFVNTEENYILIKAPKNDAYKIINILKQSNKIKVDEPTLDLKELRNKLSQDKSRIKSIIGAWITNIENTNLNTIAIFGDEVDLSDEFDEYVSQGESKIAILVIDFDTETIAINKNYSAIFYNRRSESKLLEGYEIVKGLLKNYDMFVH